MRISDWRSDVCSPDLCIAATDNGYLLPYEKLGDPRRYLARTYLGNRTVAHQVATGCRFHCTFCGVAAMFGGVTNLSSARKSVVSGKSVSVRVDNGGSRIITKNKKDTNQKNTHH